MQCDGLPLDCLLISGFWVGGREKRAVGGFALKETHQAVCIDAVVAAIATLDKDFDIYRRYRQLPFEWVFRPASR